MKQYSINILTSESIRNTYGDSSIDSFIGILIGYNNGPEYNQVYLTASSGMSEYSNTYILASGYDTKTLPDTWNTRFAGTFTFTGGTDATNADLIAWVEDNCTFVPAATPDVTVSYAGNNLVEMFEDGVKTLKTAGKYLTDDIVITYVGGTKCTLTTIIPEQTFTAAMTSLGGYQSELTSNDILESGASYLITYDGDTYVGECGLLFSSDYMVGTPSAFWSTDSGTALVPFGVDWDTTVMSVAVFDTNQHTIKVERLEFI